MSKKGTKKDTGKSTKTSGKNKQPPDEPEPWINELKNLKINDENWNCNVNMLVEQSADNLPYVSALNNVFYNGKNTRYCIKILSEHSLAADTLEKNYNANIHSLSNGYKKLSEEAIKYCSTEGISPNIPIPILASLIKYYIYSLKLKNLAEIQIVEAYKQKMQKMRDESLLGIQNIVSSGATSKAKSSGKKTAKEKTPNKTTSSKKSGKDKTTDTKVTQLRKRGEEILDFIEMQSDVPYDGPRLYIILNSFKCALLPLELLKLEIPLVSLVKLHNLCTLDNCFINEDNNQMICKGLDIICKETTVRQRRFSNVMDEHLLNGYILDTFWREFSAILNDNSNVLNFKDTIFMKFYPKLYNHDLNKKQVKDVYIEIQQSIYKQICHLQYDIADVQRQHKNYINHLTERDITEKRVFDFQKMDLYWDAVESVPPEMINIPFILDCILIQVEELVNLKETPDAKPTIEEVVASDTKVQGDTLEAKLKELDARYDLFAEDQVQEMEPELLPTVLIYGDEIDMKSHWCTKNSDLRNITSKVFECFWEQFLACHLPVYDDVISHDELQNTDLLYMLKNTGDITVRDRLCNMPCLFGDTSFIVENKASVFCTDDDANSVLNNNKLLCNNYRCNDLVSSDFQHFEDLGQGPFLGQIYDEHSYCFEEMTSDILLQNLFRSLENSNCIDAFQDYFKGRLFIKFHHRKSCRDEEYLMGTLKTKTALRDFYDYTIDEEFYWLNEDECIYDKAIQKQDLKKCMTTLNRLQYLKNKEAYMTGKICEETNFIVPYTLKYTGDDQPHGLLVIPSYSEDEPNFSSDSIIGQQSNLEAFDIDLPNRVQFSEKRQEFIISKFSKVLVKRLSRLYKEEAISVQATMHGHSLFFHHTIGSEVNKHFHFIHKSGIVFHIKKNVIENDTLAQLKQVDNTMPYNINIETLQINKTNDFNEMNYLFLKPLIYQLCLTLPNTLCLEFINPHNTSLYVKQHYLCNKFLPEEIQQERSRCYLMDGKLIKFMRDELIIIYYSNGEIFKCEPNPLPAIKQSSPVIIPEIPQKTVQSSKGKPADSKHKKAAKTEDYIEPPQPLPEMIETTIKSLEHTLANGERFLIKDGEETQLEPVFLNTFTDLFNGVIISERADGTVFTYNKEGTLFVDFPDGSRITTTASFGGTEFLYDATEEVVEELEPGLIETNAHINLEQLSDELGENEEYCIEEEEEGDINYDRYFPCKPEGFLVINVEHYFEHVNYASVLTNVNKEEVNIHLPCDVSICLSSEGLYTINCDEHSQVITEHDKFVFREVNNKNLPEFTIYLQDKIPDTTVNRTDNENETPNQDVLDKNKPKADDTDSIFNKSSKGSVKPNDIEIVDAEKPFDIICCCEDDIGNKLTINNAGDTEEILVDGIDSICKCNTINYDRVFVFNTEYNGLEVFPPDAMEFIDNEASKIENCVAQNYGTVDHNVLLLMIPLLQNELKKWLKPLKNIKYCPLYEFPSTYNDENTSYLPFTKPKEPDINLTFTPDVLLIRVINRVNCNIHLQEQFFLENKKTPDDLRLNKCPHLALELYKRGNIPFCKADKAFVEYIKEFVIGSLIARVRRRVVKRLEMRKIREYTEILVKRLLLPYFDSGRGATFIILLDILLATVQICSDDRNKLEKLFCKPLQQLTDEDLDYMHDRIAPLTVSRFCNCDEKDEFCQLRILLLAGRTLHGIFPDMITVFHSFGSNLKKKKMAEQLELSAKMLLRKPSNALTEDELMLLHDKLRTLPYITFCTCKRSSQQCKLMAILVACVTLSYIFPDVDSIFKSYKIEITL